MSGFKQFGVAPETYVLTSQGQQPIKDLHEKEVEIWNGTAFEQTTVLKVASNVSLLRVVTNTGSEVLCSSDHVFNVQPGYEADVVIQTPASELEEFTRLSKSPLFPICTGGDVEFPFAYTHGFYMGNERYHKKDGSLSRAAIYGVRHPILEFLETSEQTKQSLYFPEDLPDKWELPLDSKYTYESKLIWLAGLFDGGLIKRKTKPKPIWHIYSDNFDFLSQIKLLLQTLGGDARVVPNEDFARAHYSFRVSGAAIQNLIQLNVPTKNHKFPVINYRRRGIETPKIKTVESAFRTSDVYNFIGTQQKTAIFNGIYTACN
jgi:hypothetical protein